MASAHDLTTIATILQVLLFLIHQEEFIFYVLFVDEKFTSLTSRMNAPIINHLIKSHLNSR